MPSILVTQCLQNDFVQPIGRFDPIPNPLHVGHAEAHRLLGLVPAEGPIERTIQWAYAQPDDAVRVVHIRDWHDPAQAEQRSHLAQFGAHCIQGTKGAQFAFREPERHGKSVTIIDSVTLNDFQGTQLAEALAGPPCRIGLMGVWTEAKILFLAYELRTRFPDHALGVCSALTASSSRQHHFDALDQLRRILGVTVFDAVGGFVDWLGGATHDVPLLGMREGFPELDTGGTTLPPTDATLLRYLFRDCRTVKLKILDGGFSGNLVAGTTSIDLHGHEQVPHVVKIGPQDLMGRERTSFERIQDVLGNNAPQVNDFADLGDRGAIKYRYASMGGSPSTSFQKAYQQGLPLPEVQRVLETVFGEQLMRFYKAATLESGDLLDHYAFSPEWAPRIQRNVSQILGVADPGPLIEVSPGISVTNPTTFYRDVLPSLPNRPQDRFYQAVVHGDLNGQNIVLDAQKNVWLIDFFHTRRAHVLMDLIKLENDLLYLLTPLACEDDLREAFQLTEALMAVGDLSADLPETSPSPLPQLARAWATLRMLRAFYPRLIHSDRDPFQVLVGLLRYAGHTLSFDEPTLLQRRWALYAAGRTAAVLAGSLSASTRLRVDFLDDPRLGTARVGLTLLPGRRDRRRDLASDLGALRDAGATALVTLVPTEELERYGASALLDQARAAGFDVLHVPLLDQKAADTETVRAAVTWIAAHVARGEAVVVHCVGGLGRSGMVAAAWLRSLGWSAPDALAAVRACRGPRAVETAVQEAFVFAYEALTPIDGGASRNQS